MSTGIAVEHVPAQAEEVKLATLIKLAWPIILSRSTQVIIGVTDAVMVAPLGEEALAATTTGAFNAFALLVLPMGILFIVSTFSAQLAGQGDRVGARRYGFYGLIVAGLTQLLCFASLPAIPWVLGHLAYAPHVRELMAAYLAIRLLTGGAAMGVEALGNYYGGLGNTRLPMAMNVLAMVLNVLGCFLFIGGHWGAPALGVRGSALAAALASLIAFIAFVVVFLRDRGDAPMIPRLSAREFFRMLKFGIPSGFNWFFEFFAYNFFINVVMAGLGTSALAAMMAVFQINSVAFMPGFGLASAGAILVGQSIGAKRMDEVRKAVRLSFASSASWQLFVAIAYLAVPGLLLSSFVDPQHDSSEFMRIGVRILMLSAAWQLFDAASMNLAETLRAAGDTSFTLWARIVIAWGVFAPGAFITVRYLGWGDVGAVSWIVIYLALLSFTLLLRFRSGAWKKISLFAG